MLSFSKMKEYFASVLSVFQRLLFPSALPMLFNTSIAARNNDREIEVKRGQKKDVKHLVCGMCEVEWKKVLFFIHFTK